MLQHVGLVLLYILLFLLNLSVLLGIPGGWIALGAIALYGVATRFASVGWKWLVVMGGVLVVGEVIEFLLGIVYVARKGASRWGVLGAFVGGIAGIVVGSMILPLVGSVIFGLVGAFAVAVVFEFIYYKSLERALQTGFAAFVGKLAAMFVKLGLSLANVGLFIYLSWN